jgi:thiopeptide-type bacteriocin biosynthesis protein
MVPTGAVANPGYGEVLKAVLIGNPTRFDDVLAGHLAVLVGDLGGVVSRWWITRHRDLLHLDADQHLGIVLRLAGPDCYAAAAGGVSGWAARLQSRGLIAGLALTGYQAQPGRYGDGAAMRAAERVFAADTQAAIAQIAMAAGVAGRAQAVAAASLATLAAGFTGGYQCLVDVLEQETGALDRGLREEAVRLADPAAGFGSLRELNGGARVAVAWDERGLALAAYRDALRGQREPVSVLRSLMHDHHVRALGVDPDLERVTNRLARAAALRQVARARASAEATAGVPG